MDEASEKKQKPPTTRILAKALEKNNLLDRIHTILISTNNRLASTEFKRKKDMEELCKDGLAFEDFETEITDQFHCLIAFSSEILDIIRTAVICLPDCDVINFEINLIFRIKSFFYKTKKSRQKSKYLENEKSF